MSGRLGAVARFLTWTMGLLAAAVFSLPGGAVLYELVRQTAGLRMSPALEATGAILCALAITLGLFSRFAIVRSASWAVAMMGCAALGSALSPGRTIVAQLSWLAGGAVFGAAIGLWLSLRGARRATAAGQGEEMAEPASAPRATAWHHRFRVTGPVWALWGVLACFLVLLLVREGLRASWQARVAAAVAPCGGHVLFDDFAVPTLLLRWIDRLPGADARRSLRCIVVGQDAGNQELAALMELGIADLPDLTDLRLGRSRVTDEGLEPLAPMVRLQWLGLGPTTTDAGLVHLRNMTELRWLDLSCTQVTGAGLVHPRELPVLANLNLRDSRVSNEELPQLKRFPRLMCLDLSGTRVTDDGLEHLKDLPNLQTLILENTRISDQAIPHLQGMPRLCWLFLDRTQVTEAGLRDLWGQRPGLQVIR